MKVKVETAPMESSVQGPVETAAPVSVGESKVIDQGVSELSGCELPPPVEYTLKGKTTSSIRSFLPLCLLRP